MSGFVVIEDNGTAFDMTEDLDCSLADTENQLDPPEAPAWYETTEAWAWENGWTAGYAAHRQGKSGE